ncbi:hypothetical protein QCA50_010602 [Cerrena zonata]|uniref:DUF6535 domain-containing protein n=1 Tax=Cerrena zonata TaxID=2478898 RepID=A0AAW0FXY9_9APHY
MDSNLDRQSVSPGRAHLPLSPANANPSNPDTVISNSPSLPPSPQTRSASAPPQSGHSPVIPYPSSPLPTHSSSTTHVSGSHQTPYSRPFLNMPQFFPATQYQNIHTQYIDFIRLDDNMKLGGKEADVLAGTLKMYDEVKVKKAVGDIDSLLVLATIFSAIVAAFTIESYKDMKTDSSIASATLIAQLVLHFNGTDGLEHTGFSFSPLPPAMTSRDVLVNSFWFLSLACSIITASIGIFTKEWLNNYLHMTCSSAEEWVRVRQVRHASLLRWKVFDLVAFLPLLLQLALLLFLIGLVVFLSSINTTVEWLVATSVVIYITSLVFTLVAPMVSASCPYQISFFRFATEYVRGFLIRAVYGSSWRQRLGYGNPFYRFPGDERGVRREARVDVEAVIDADSHLRDNTILEHTIQPCIASFGLESTLSFVREVLANRLDRPVSNLQEVSQIDYESIPRQVWTVLLNVYQFSIGSLLYPTRKSQSLPHVMSDKNRLKDTIELLWGFHRLVECCRRHGHAWSVAAHTCSFPELCLDPVIPPDISEKSKIVHFGVSQFIAMTLECPTLSYMCGEFTVSTTAIKQFIQSATKMLRSSAGSGLVDRPALCSITRLIFGSVQVDDRYGMDESLVRDLKAFNIVLLAAMRQLYVIADNNPNRDGPDLVCQASTAYTAASNLCYHLPWLIEAEILSTLEAWQWTREMRERVIHLNK